MIEVARARLDPIAQERWTAVLGRAAVACPTPRDETVPSFLFALIWVAVYVATFGVLATEVSSGAVVAIRLFAAGAFLVMVRIALRTPRAPGQAWPSGRYFFSWGYAEVEDDVLRVVPMDEIRLALYGRFLGVGPIRLHLRAGVWSTTLAVDPRELPAVDAILEQRDAQIELGGTGYRDAPAKIEGLRVPPPRPRVARELGLAAAFGALATLLPVVLTPPAASTPESADTDGYVAALGASPAATPDWDVSPCASRLAVDTIASYLSLALESPRLGPARPFAPSTLVPPSGRDRFWTQCTWEVDQQTGLLHHTEVRWGLDRGGQHRLERRAVVESSEVLRTIDECARLQPRFDVSPRGLAETSSALALMTILADIAAEIGMPPIDDAHAAVFECVHRRVARIPVTHVRDR